MAQLLPLDRRFHLCSHCRWFILLEKVNRLEVFTPLCVDGGIPKIEERSILGKPRLFLVKEQAEGTLWEIVRVSWPIILTCGPSLHMNTTATGTGTVLLKLSMMCFHFFHSIHTLFHSSHHIQHSLGEAMCKETSFDCHEWFERSGDNT